MTLNRDPGDECGCEGHDQQHSHAPTAPDAEAPAHHNETNPQTPNPGGEN